MSSPVPICPRCRIGKHNEHQHDFQVAMDGVRICRCPRCTIDKSLPGSGGCSRTWVRDPTPALSGEPFHWFGDGLIFDTTGPAKCGATPKEGKKWVDVVRTKRPKRICQACIEVKRKVDDEFLNPRKAGTGIPEDAVVLRDAVGKEVVYFPTDAAMDETMNEAYRADWDPKEDDKWP